MQAPARTPDAHQHRLVGAVDLDDARFPVVFDGAAQRRRQHGAAAEDDAHGREHLAWVEAFVPGQIVQQHRFERQTRDGGDAEPADEVHRAVERHVPAHRARRDVAGAGHAHRLFEHERHRREERKAVEQHRVLRQLRNHPVHDRRHGAQLVQPAPGRDRLAGRAAGLVVVPGALRRDREHAERCRVAQMVFEGERQAAEVGAPAQRASGEMLGVERSLSRPLDGAPQQLVAIRRDARRGAVTALHRTSLAAFGTSW
jgi:hypothetical protein